MNRNSSVIIIGAGPAGASAAIFLAKAGLKVSLIEKDRHPRYHIGESGILSLTTLLELLEVHEEVKALGVKKKGGVLFDWNKKWAINWGESGQYTYHVIRSEFDQLLFEKAKSLGVEVYEKALVKEIEFEHNEPKKVKGIQDKKPFEITCDYLIDASGRSSLVAKKYWKSQKPLENFKNVALWSYWHKADLMPIFKEFELLEGKKLEIDHPITLSALPHGWIWGIPLHNQTMSVGVVLEQKAYLKIKEEKDLKTCYIDALKESKVFKTLLSKAIKVSEVSITQDWSYYSQIFAQNKTFLVGDAAAFIDPLLSTGMTSGMLSSLVASTCIIELEKKQLDEKEIYNFYQQDFEKRFWRLTFVIAALYEAKKDPKDLFSKAHRLTSKDLKNSTFESLKSSFGSLIGGMEDIKELSAYELQKKAGERVRDHFKESIGKLLSEEEQELALTFKPLGLKRTSKMPDECTIT